MSSCTPKREAPLAVGRRLTRLRIETSPNLDPLATSHHAESTFEARRVTHSKRAVRGWCRPPPRPTPSASEAGHPRPRRLCARDHSRGRQ